MEALDLRQSVLEYIKNKADHRFLKLVKGMASSYSEEETLESDTIEQYNKEIDQAIAEVERGEFYTQEEVEKMAKEW
jgi:predicted transcriptional regulator